MLSPRDATYSYQAPEDTSIWGPFCSDCMNRWYNSGQFGLSTPFYLHLQRRAVLCKLEGLFAKNGRKNPFTFGILEEEMRKNDCSYEGCRQNKKNCLDMSTAGEEPPSFHGRLEETSFFSLASPRKEASSQTEVGDDVILEEEMERNPRNEEERADQTARAVEETPPEQMAFKRLASNVYEEHAREADLELEVGQAAEEDESELEFSSPVASTDANNQEKSCSFSPEGKTVCHMHLPSDKGPFLSGEELVAVSKKAYKLMEKKNRCSETSYELGKAICVPTCFVCGFRPGCSCEYLLHVFGPLHCGVLVKNKVPVSRQAFNFWLEQMFQLRKMSRYYIPDLQLDLSGQATLKERKREYPALLHVFQLQVFSRLPVACNLEEEATTLTFMNAHTTSRDHLIEETYLVKLTEAIRIHYSSECYKPVHSCPYIRHYCSQVCALCGFISKCACRYVFHLFGTQHVGALIKNQVKVCQSDVRFWQSHLEAFSQKGVNCQMRPILKPLVSLVPDVSSFEYPLHTVAEKTSSWTTSKLLTNWKNVFR